MPNSEVPLFSRAAARLSQLSNEQRCRIAKSQALRLLAKSAHSDWMDECVPKLMDMGKDQTVAVAACLNMWRDAWEETHPDGADDTGAAGSLKRKSSL